MKKSIFIAIAIVFAAACATTLSATPAPKGPRLSNVADSLSYAIGVDFGVNVKQFLQDKVSVDAIAAAIKDVLNERQAMTVEEARAFLTEYFSVRMPAENLRKAEAFLKVTAKKKTVQKTDSGLLYEIVRPGDMSVRATEDSDTVEVNYVGTLADGTEFDSNNGISFRLNQVISGWTEGMKLIGRGGKIRLYIHPEHGYGERGSGTGTIPPNAALVFEVELLDVNPPSSEK